MARAFSAVRSVQYLVFYPVRFGVECVPSLLHRSVLAICDLWLPNLSRALSCDLVSVCGARGVHHRRSMKGMGLILKM